MTNPTSRRVARTTDTSPRVLFSALALCSPMSSGAVLSTITADASEMPIPWHSQQVTDSAAKEPDRVGERFARLSAQWKRDTRHVSSASRIASHPAYWHVIGMGPTVIPFLLRDLPAPWFHALWAISGVDPVAPDQQGNVSAMVQAWKAWGRREGHLDENE